MHLTPAEQQRLRERVFAWLDELMVTNGSPEMTRAQLLSFTYEGVRIPLLDTSRGIRNPAVLDTTLTVMTSAKSDTGYSDEIRPDGLIRYSLERGGADRGANRKLLAALGTQTPLVYFHGVRPGVFEATYPVYVRRFDPAEECVYLEPDEAFKLYGDPLALAEIDRSYVEQKVRGRRHQTLFRAQVMSAYSRVCAVCELQQYVLLDAAHITADAEAEGIAHVSNGLSLCKLHHTAYDRDLIGISEDYRVRVRGDLLHDGDLSPTHRAAFIGVDGKPLRLPEHRELRPDRDRLGHRYQRFVALAH